MEASGDMLRPFSCLRQGIGQRSCLAWHGTGEVSFWTSRVLGRKVNYILYLRRVWGRIRIKFFKKMEQ